MKLTQLRDVVTVAERGSLRRAARHLGLAQPAITRSIREIERELGVSLFDRQAKGMVLTPMGDLFVRRAGAIQDELRRAREEIDQLRGQAIGRVAVGLSTVSHLALLPRALADFRARFPEVMLDISEGLYPTMEIPLTTGKLDFYIGPLPDEVQQATFFSAGIVTGAKEPEAARALIKFFTSAKAAPVIAKTGLEPVGSK